MKRFYLFAGSTYYPCGPADYIGFFNTKEEALARAKGLLEDWAYVMDIDGVVVATLGDSASHGMYPKYEPEEPDYE